MSSIYLPDEVKERLIRAARRRGFEVKQGRQSQLADYITFLVENDEQSETPNRKKGTLARALKLFDQPGYQPSTDEEIEQLLDERRMRN